MRQDQIKSFGVTAFFQPPWKLEHAVWFQVLDNIKQRTMPAGLEMNAYHQFRWAVRWMRPVCSWCTPELRSNVNTCWRRPVARRRPPDARAGWHSLHNGSTAVRPVMITPSKNRHPLATTPATAVQASVHHWTGCQTFYWPQSLIQAYNITGLLLLLLLLLLLTATASTPAAVATTTPTTTTTTTAISFCLAKCPSRELLHAGFDPPKGNLWKQLVLSVIMPLTMFTVSFKGVAVTTDWDSFESWEQFQSGVRPYRF